MTTRSGVLIFLASLGLVALAQAVTAGDWPAWRGPSRDGISKETGLLKEWPKDGPKLCSSFFFCKEIDSWPPLSPVPAGVASR